MHNANQIFQDWQIFYVTIAGVAATLSGLLFVAISINKDVFSNGNFYYKRLARLTLANFFYLLVISLVSIFPGQSPYGIGITIVIMCALGTWDNLTYFWQIRQKEDSIFTNFHPTPLITYLAMAGFAILNMVRFDETWLYWLASAMIVLLISAARNAWDLMVKSPKA